MSVSVVGRMVACREALTDGKEWSFYFINDSAAPCHRLVLKRVSSEWGSNSAIDAQDIAIGDVAPGAHALVWRDDGSGAEFRMTIQVAFEREGRAVVLGFEFPKLYRQRDLPVVAGLGKPGLQVRPGQ